jgi:hypothetical protein
MTSSQITHSLMLFFFIRSTKQLFFLVAGATKFDKKNKQNMRIYAVCACVLALRNLITVVIDGLYFPRILNPKYLNDDDDDEGG